MTSEAVTMGDHLMQSLGPRGEESKGGAIARARPCSLRERLARRYFTGRVERRRLRPDAARIRPRIPTASAEVELPAGRAAQAPLPAPTISTHSPLSQRLLWHWSLPVHIEPMGSLGEQVPSPTLHQSPVGHWLSLPQPQ